MKARYAFHMSTVDMYDIPPAMRGIEEWIVAVMARNARKWGRWAAARWAAKRGFPIELVLASIYY